MATSWLARAAAAPREDEALHCVQCRRPVVHIDATSAYEKVIRSRQVIHRLCERCARVTSEVGDHMDGLWRKARFLGY